MVSLGIRVQNIFTAPKLKNEIFVLTADSREREREVCGDRSLSISHARKINKVIERKNLSKLQSNIQGRFECEKCHKLTLHTLILPI